MTILRAAFCAALAFLTTSPSLAEDVVLTSRDGSVEISGTLLGFDGEFYRVDTVYGELTVDGAGVACSGPGCPMLTGFVAEVDFSGAESVGSVLLPALISGFAQREGLSASRDMLDENHVAYMLRDRVTARQVALFRVRLTNTEEGFADLLADEADIVLALREAREAEVRLARDAGLGDLRARGRSRVLALDALVPVVAPDNPIDRITTPDLADVLSGEIDNWQTLGGPDASVTVHLMGAESGLAQAVVDQVLQPARAKAVESAVRHDSMEALTDAVAADPFGIGVAAGAALGQVKPLALSGACGLDLQAERRTVKTEDYPLTAPVFLYLPARRLPRIARDFLAYLRTPPAQLVIRRAGFVDQTPEEIPIDAQGNRFLNAILVGGQEVGLEELQRMVTTLQPLQRLSTTFRFEAGSSRLDAQSRSNVEQLARAFEAGQYDGRRILFVGFSDGDGPARVNRDIALRRAEAALSAVVTAAETANLSRLTLEVDAFGEAMPMACDDSSWGRQVNRRVEVWVR